MPRCTPIISNSGGHLAVLVGKAIQKDGLNCDLNHIDVSGVEDFKGVFRKWPKFQGDISKWVIHGINADAMFDVVPLEPVVATDNKHLQALIRQALHVNGDASSLNHIDVSGITDFSDVFAESPTFNGDISGWNVSNVTDMSDMFAHSRFNGDVSSWDVRRVVDFSGIFLKSKFNGDLSRWQVSKDAKCQNTISADRLSAMPKPSFFHWERALRTSLDMPWEWNAHFCATQKTARMLGMCPPEAAVFLQERWLWGQQPEGEAVELPGLEP